MIVFCLYSYFNDDHEHYCLFAKTHQIGCMSLNKWNSSVPSYHVAHDKGKSLHKYLLIQCFQVAQSNEYSLWQCPEGTKITRISPWTADDIWLWPQNKHCEWRINLLVFHTVPPCQLLKDMVQTGPHCLDIFPQCFGDFYEL